MDLSCLGNKEDFLTLVSLKNGTKEVEQKEWKSKIIDFTFFLSLLRCSSLALLTLYHVYLLAQEFLAIKNNISNIIFTFQLHNKGC
jgi:hypothetical protein